jgi:hypothetical protein
VSYGENSFCDRQMKQTHKFQSLGDAAAVVRAARSITAAARQLGVGRCTIHRWIEAGKVPRPGGRHGIASPKRHVGPARPAAVADLAVGEAVPETTGEPASGDEASSWARSVRDQYDLTATEQMLVDLAERALTLARDSASRSEVQLAAMARFQQLVRQLNLERELADGDIEKAKARVVGWPRRVDGAPASA